MPAANLESLLQEIASTPNKFQAHAQAGLRLAARKPALRKALVEAQAARARARVHLAVEHARAQAELEEQLRSQQTARSERSDETSTTDAGSINSNESRHTDVGTSGETSEPDVSVDSCDDSHDMNASTPPQGTGARNGASTAPCAMMRREATWSAAHSDGVQRFEKLADNDDQSSPDHSSGRSGIDQLPSDPLARRATHAGVLQRERDGLAVWPAEVQEALDVADIMLMAHHVLPPTAKVDEKLRVLRVVGAGCSIPHPEKGTDGADSFYIDAVSNSMGVADGVGEWEWRFKCSARAFADELMEGSKQAARVVATTDGSIGKVAVDMLQQGHDSTRAFGAATALVAKLGGQNNKSLGVACLGDASMLHLRREQVGQQVAYRCLARTKEQQHSFNCPFQLSRLPVPDDFPRLVKEGKGALVRAVERSLHLKAKQDQPEDAEWYVYHVQQGDLIVMGTDGLFDNLYDQEICQLADCAVTPFEVRGLASEKPGTDGQRCEEELASRLASALAKAACIRSQSSNGKTPFGDHARQVGMHHMGGKMDDITCLCSWVV
mmetsp:Transcript_36701/g.84454  ORF Transcript_36701/g.84454 Transcript_36701/m.84454 type:complete len:553 (+) Transcript_36701:66-1724(+)